MLGVDLDGWEVVFWSGAAQLKKSPQEFWGWPRKRGRWRRFVVIFSGVTIYISLDRSEVVGGDFGIYGTKIKRKRLERFGDWGICTPTF